MWRVSGGVLVVGRRPLDAQQLVVARLDVCAAVLGRTRTSTSASGPGRLLCAHVEYCRRLGKAMRATVGRQGEGFVAPRARGIQRHVVASGDCGLWAGKFGMTLSLARAWRPSSAVALCASRQLAIRALAMPSVLLGYMSCKLQKRHAALSFFPRFPQRPAPESPPKPALRPRR